MAKYDEISEMDQKDRHIKGIILSVIFLGLMLIIGSIIFFYLRSGSDLPNYFHVRDRDRKSINDLPKDNSNQPDQVPKNSDSEDDDGNIPPVLPDNDNIEPEIIPPPMIDPIPTIQTLQLGDCTDWTELRSVSIDEKVIFLTFDAGSTKEALDNILLSLNDKNWKASFFMTGVWMSQYPDDTIRIADAGHDMYNHSFDHADFKTLNEQQMIQELVQTETMLSNLTGLSSKPFFRPPYGSRDQRVVSTVCSAGYYTIYWSYDTLDWKSGVGYSAEEIKIKFLSSLEPGGIYLMHLGSESTKESIAQIVQGISAQGFRVAPLSEFLEVIP